MHPLDTCICAHQRREHRKSEPAQLTCSLCYCADFKIAHRAESGRAEPVEAAPRLSARQQPQPQPSVQPTPSLSGIE
jgi:hypothetical protein